MSESNNFWKNYLWLNKKLFMEDIWTYKLMYVCIYIHESKNFWNKHFWHNKKCFFDITRSDSWKIYGYESKFKCINETIIFCRFSGFNTLSNATEKTTSQRPKQPSQADPWGKIGLIAMTIPKLIVSNSQVEPWKIHLSHGQWNTGWLRLVSLCL